MPNISQHELLPFVIQGNNVLVDATLLHRKLKVKTKFADWIKSRINKYGFEINKDYFSEVSEKSGVGRKAINFFLTLDMAKEMAMLEENETGREIRRYFIAKEKELRGISHLPREASVFKGLKPQNINGRKLYPYRELLGRIGYNNTSGGASQRVKSYPGHFVKMGNLQYISEEFAQHLYHQKQVYNNRVVMRQMQPVLPFNFGDTSVFTAKRGGSHA